MVHQSATESLETRQRSSGIIPLRKKTALPVEVGEFWTAKQRQMHPIHYAISYRASFKPELPDFFLRKYLPSGTGGRVLDPFGGRGTTAIQANLLGHSAVHNDLNPVCKFLASSRQTIAPLESLKATLGSLDLAKRNRRIEKGEKERLSPFFHEKTLIELMNLRHELKRNESPEMKYIGLTALSRLHGHSDGFFSVYSFPQISIMPGAQRRNNLKRGVVPDYRGIRERIERKMARDLSQPLPAHYHAASVQNHYCGHDARDLASVKSESVDLIVTSPPFLNKVDYLTDNWMRAWFLDLEERIEAIELMVTPDLNEWVRFMNDVIVEMGRLLVPGGRAVIEVGEVSVGGKILNLEEFLANLSPIRVPGGRMEAERVFIHSQKFTKLANCWDVRNNELGTNTNRCIVIRKE